MKTKKLSQTKKIMISAATLLASLGVAGGSTFAWFTSNSTVTVSGFTSNIISGTDSLTMAVVAPNTDESYTNFFGTTYSTSVDSQDIKDVIGNSTYLGAVTPKNVGTTEDAIYDGTAFTTEDPDNDVEAVNSPNESTGGYISFKIFFRNRARTSDNRESYIIMSTRANSIDGGGNTIPFSVAQYPTIARYLGYDADTDAFTTAGYYGDEVTSTTSITAHSANAARVSFIITDSEGNETGKVWSPHEKFSDGSNGDAASTTGATLQSGRGFYLNNLGSDFRHDTIGSATAVVQKAYTSIVKAGDKVSNNFITFTGDNQDSTYSYTAVKINLWIEGTDGDCFDAILLNELTLQLAFEIERAPVTTDTTT